MLFSKALEGPSGRSAIRLTMSARGFPRIDGVLGVKISDKTTIEVR